MEDLVVTLICGVFLIAAVSPVITYIAYKLSQKTMYLEFAIGGGAGWLVAPVLLLATFIILSQYDFGNVAPRDTILPSVYFILGPILGAFFGILTAIGRNTKGKRHKLLPCTCGGGLSGFGMSLIGAYPFMA